MAGKRDRAFALFGAGLFLLTSSALTIAIVVQNVSASRDKKAAEAKAKTSQTAKSTDKKETKVDNTKLKGTQLANFTPTLKIEKLSSEDTTPGSGNEVKKGATLTVDYTGAVASTGKIFESSKDSGQKATFPLAQVIKGWQESIPGMKVGGTRRLFIPAALAYGPEAKGADIPANSDLVFDVTVYETK